jgi:hypothetical protein
MLNALLGASLDRLNTCTKFNIADLSYLCNLMQQNFYGIVGEYTIVQQLSSSTLLNRKRFVQHTVLWQPWFPNLWRSRDPCDYSEAKTRDR